VKTEPLLPYPWPFPQWDGTRWVMPAELMPKELREKAKKGVDLEDYEEAPF
jgi:hypothetical protein